MNLAMRRTIPFLILSFLLVGVGIWMTGRWAESDPSHTALAHSLSVAFLLVLLALAAASLLLGQRIYSHFEAINSMLARYATGDLAERIADIRSPLEITELARSTNGIGTSQCAQIAEIRATAEILEKNSRIFVGACETVGTQSEAMRSATNTIAAALEQISASVATIAAQSNQIDGTAQLISESTHKLNQASDETAQSIREQYSSLEASSADLAQARGKIGELQESSHAITEFATQILDVVSRTRLLALNATIEAARAGEAGKGFAVVAGEVKDLAAQTSEMAEGIQKRIGEIEGRTENVATSLDAAHQSMGQLRDNAARTIASVNGQAALTQSTDASLRNILAGTADMSRALSEAQKGIGEIEQNAIETDSRAASLHRNLVEIKVHAKDLDRAGKTLAGSIAHLKERAPFFPWQDSLALGIEVIDEQHKVLVRLLNHLHDLIASHSPAQTIDAVLTQLADYTKFHFADEERFMQDMGYQDLPGHQEIHRKFIDEINGLVETRRRGQAIDGQALLEHLRKWLTGHIMGIDRKYAQIFVSSARKG